ncbi:U3 small nucleolar ribonucleoprotein protein MPP10 [Neocloeon triangulifer]|uniref:U3 small nucleolar ribonucleoprotein protein MPP10 n=1 Tax=Neocloeon triangulifer TaxID=2078957 RepID=UPI00286F4651|nr:U3 small nucleolar ribonucleoprotein protein MPP10 [Neocloeon triangulifer]
MLPFWSTVAEKLETLTSKPDKFLTTQPKIADEIRGLAKEIYDSALGSERDNRTKQALPELIVERFDDEQVWQQLELQNVDVYDNVMCKVSQLMAKASTAKVLKKFKTLENVEAPENMNEEAGAEEFEAKQTGTEIIKQSKPKKPSVVDDKFFKLHEMEEFLLNEEKDDGGMPKEDGHGMVNYFANDTGSNDEEETDDAFYKDFFDAPEEENLDKIERASVGSEEDLEEEESLDEGSENKTGGSDGEMGSDEGGIEDEGESPSEDEAAEVVIPNQTKRNKNLLKSDDEESEEWEDNGPKSNFELRQKRLEKKIDQIHDDALGEKPWQLLGEISASTRPQNSLLEEVLQFDRTQRPAPVITEETTMKLEDIIRQRIKDKAWDNVERKIKPVEEPTEYKKRLNLDQAKSKLSLAEIYEQDYLKQKLQANRDPGEEEGDEKETSEQTEIKSMMHNLFIKLDALSNYHYTPRPAAPDVKVVCNLPAITVEEVAPAATSDAALLAPEEIKGKAKGIPLGKEERNATDKKRERRKKKAKQRAKKKLQDSKETLGGGAKAAVTKALKEGRVTKLDVTDKEAVKSSKAFFTKLQDEVSNTINLKKQEIKKRKGEESRLSAKKLKL